MHGFCLTDLVVQHDVFEFLLFSNNFPNQEFLWYHFLHLYLNLWRFISLKMTDKIDTGGIFMKQQIINDENSGKHSKELILNFPEPMFYTILEW